MQHEFYQLAEDLADTDPPRILFEIHQSDVDIEADAFLSTTMDKPLPLLDLKVLSSGRLCDFNLPAIAIPVLSTRLAEYFGSHCSSEVRLGDVRPENVGWKSLHIATVLDCIDHVRSRLQYRPPHYPDAFMVYGVISLSLDARRIPDSVKIFRLKEWAPCLIIRETIATDLLSLGFTGFKLNPIPVYQNVACNDSYGRPAMGAIESSHKSLTICPLCWDPILSADDIVRIPAWFLAEHVQSQFGTLHRACFEHWKIKCGAF